MVNLSFKREEAVRGGPQGELERFRRPDVGAVIMLDEATTAGPSLGFGACR